MGIIPTRIHGILDYVVGLLLIAAPWLFRFSDNRAAALVPIALGVAAIIYSLMTNYELGVVHILPMRIHLWIDFASGALLLLSPWLFGFHNRITWPHVVVGLLEIGVAALTQRTPGMAGATSTDDISQGRPGMA